MNRVVSIEIATQVFWIDESAFGDLTSYMQTIKQQLAADENANDIYQDIELRVAELLYGFNHDARKAITKEQVSSVIEQVGFIELDETQSGVDRQSLECSNIASASSQSKQDDQSLNQNNDYEQQKLLGGVCARLAIRTKIPAFILRLTVLGLNRLFWSGCYFISSFLAVA